MKEKKLKAKKSPAEKFRFIDLFAGIGGFHIAMHAAGGECVFASEWDKFARQTYEANFKSVNPDLFASGRFIGDINSINDRLDFIPDFDVLCAGFPCQPFSHAGHKKGFEDMRGTLFFNIAEIVNHKLEQSRKDGKRRPPKVLLLENVKGLRGHDKGNTLKVIVETLQQLGYIVNYEVLNTKYFGVPQNRERLFIVAWLKSKGAPEAFSFPYGISETNKVIYDREQLLEKHKKVRVGDVLDKNVMEKYTISEALYAGHLRRREEHKVKGNGFGFSMFNEASPYTSTISARYYKDGSEALIAQRGKRPRVLTPEEAGRLQGYPTGESVPASKRFVIPVSNVQAYKQFGNSVSIPVVKALAKEIKKQLL